MDRDGDGYGEHCPNGGDCDDRNGAVSQICSATVDCLVRPDEPACRCENDSERSCYTGPLETQQQGVCHSGTQRCIDERWQACGEQRLPGAEQCNRIDDDCDGVIDEGVHSPCGECDSECTGQVWGDVDLPFAPSPPLTTLSDGTLTLSYVPILSGQLWVANTADSTVSHIDPIARTEQARHAVRGSPLRLAVDYHGDAFVLGADDDTWYLSKIAAERECAQNTDDSSTPSAARAPCIRWSSKLGTSSTSYAALAVDGTRGAGDSAHALSGHPWVGLPDRLIQLDGESGEVLQRMDIPGLTPSDGVFDLRDQLWIADPQGVLWQISGLGSGVPVVIPYSVPNACYRLFALAARSDDNLLMSTADCESVLRFDPAQLRFASVTTAALLTTASVLSTESGDYVVHAEGAVSALEWASLSLGPAMPLAGAAGAAQQSIALGATSDGALWIPSHHSSESATGWVTRLDPATATVTDQLQVGRGPAALGDLSGQRLLGSFPERGAIEQRFTGCNGEMTEFEALHVDFEAPSNGSVEVAFRAANALDALASQSYSSAHTLHRSGSIPLGDLAANHLQVRLVLRSGGHHSAPRVRRVGLEWTCTGPE